MNAFFDLRIQAFVENLMKSYENGVVAGIAA